ncbi:hypothetical protein [Breoghania sp.]|uniref:hypothetical protein n=1 Tax=Breoghania sp. TaxID=2065378 RepID=UPI00262A6B39|nr:hypothetical protein [Breoghania sp.]MDJ0932242.1 hypothetical protein [Breoghania sp.]
MKSDFGDLQSFAGAVAGRVVEVKAQATAHDTETRQKELDYLPSSIRQEARSFAASLATRYNPGSVDLDALIDNAERSVSSGRPVQAVTYFGRALILAGEHSDLWLAAAKTVNAARLKDW